MAGFCGAHRGRARAIVGRGRRGGALARCGVCADEVWCPVHADSIDETAYKVGQARKGSGSGRRAPDVLDA